MPEVPSRTVKIRFPMTEDPSGPARAARGLAAEIPALRMEAVERLGQFTAEGEATTGGGLEFDSVQLFNDTTAGVVTFTAWVTFADYIVRAVRWLRQSGQSEAVVDSAGAEWIAVRYLAHESTFRDTKLGRTTALWTPDTYPDEGRPSTYLVRVNVRGRKHLVVVAGDGSVLGCDVPNPAHGDDDA